MLELLAKQHNTWIGYLINSGCPVSIAEDIVQDAFIKSFKSLESFREDSSFYTWIYRITVNTAKNYLVSKKRKDELLQSDMNEEAIHLNEPINHETPEEELKSQQLKELILHTLNSLGEDTKTALTLREFDGLSYEQISKIVNCPVGTVRSRIFRGREVLDHAIKEFREGNYARNREAV